MTPFDHLSEDSHINRPLRAEPITASSTSLLLLTLENPVLRTYAVFLAMNFAASSPGMPKPPCRRPHSSRRSASSLLPVSHLPWMACTLRRAALGLFCLATAILFHTNFASRNELLHFEKDLTIAGGMFVLMLRGAGEYSVQAFARQREEREGGWQWRFRAF